jgi:hypothetical protein
MEEDTKTSSKHVFDGTGDYESWKRNQLRRLLTSSQVLSDEEQAKAVFRHLAGEAADVAWAGEDLQDFPFLDKSVIFRKLDEIYLGAAKQNKGEAMRALIRLRQKGNLEEHAQEFLALALRAEIGKTELAGAFQGTLSQRLAVATLNANTTDFGAFMQAAKKADAVVPRFSPTKTPWKNGTTKGRMTHSTGEKLCHGCQKPGHFQYDCPTNPKARRNQGPSGYMPRGRKTAIEDQPEVIEEPEYPTGNE